MSELNRYAYRQLRDKQRAKHLPCWICGLPIDYHAPPRTRWSFSLDHVVPRSLGGDALSEANARSSHLSCNSGRGNGTRGTQAPPPSRRW